MWERHFVIRPSARESQIRNLVKPSVNAGITDFINDISANTGYASKCDMYFKVQGYVLKGI